MGLSGVRVSAARLVVVHLTVIWFSTRVQISCGRLFVNALGGVAWREVHVYLCAGASMPLVRVLRVVHVVLGVRPSR